MKKRERVTSYLVVRHFRACIELCTCGVVHFCAVSEVHVHVHVHVCEVHA